MQFKLKKKKNSALPMQAVCVRSLVGELRLHKPHSGAKNQRETGLNRAWTLATAGLTACRPPPSSSRGRGQGQSSPVALPALRPHSVRAPCAGSPTRLPVCTRPGSLHGGVCNYSSDGSNEPKSPGPSTSACSSVKRHSDTHPGGPSQGVSELHYVKRSPARLTSASH